MLSHNYADAIHDLDKSRNYPQPLDNNTETFANTDN
jgi:hypothetical protein